MKALYIPLSILLLLLAFSLWTGAYVEGRAERWSELLGQADRLAGEGRWAETEEQLALSYRSWLESRTFLHTLMEHDDLDEVETLFAAAFSACDVEDVPDFHTALAQLSKKLSLLAETQSLSVKNIL